MTPVKHSDEQRLFNLFVSTAWLALCLSILIGTASADIGNYPFQPQSVTTFLIAIPAIWGLYAWRWQSLSELLVPSDAAGPLPGTTNPAHMVTNFFGDQLQLRLSWLAQSLANLCLVQLLLTTWRPFLLASMYASLIVVLELSWVLMRMFVLLQRRDGNPIHATNNSPTPESAKTSPPAFTKLDETPESLDPAMKDANYHDLLALRANLEKNHEAAEVKNFEQNSAVESDDQRPRQLLRDQRDQLGYGTIQGETRVIVPNDSDVQVVTIAFVPPFPSQPELLTECESELVDSVRVLQCQPLGAKVEVKFLSNKVSYHPSDVTLYWEATVEPK